MQADPPQDDSQSTFRASFYLDKSCPTLESPEQWPQFNLHVRSAIYRIRWDPLLKGKNGITWAIGVRSMLNGKALEGIRKYLGEEALHLTQSVTTVYDMLSILESRFAPPSLDIYHACCSLFDLNLASSSGNVETYIKSFLAAEKTLTTMGGNSCQIVLMCFMLQGLGSSWEEFTKKLLSDSVIAIPTTRKPLSFLDLVDSIRNEKTRRKVEEVTHQATPPSQQCTSPQASNNGEVISLVDESPTGARSSSGITSVTMISSGTCSTTPGTIQQTEHPSSVPSTSHQQPTSSTPTSVASSSSAGTSPAEGQQPADVSSVSAPSSELPTSSNTSASQTSDSASETHQVERTISKSTQASTTSVQVVAESTQASRKLAQPSTTTSQPSGTKSAQPSTTSAQVGTELAQPGTNSARVRIHPASSTPLSIEIDSIDTDAFSDFEDDDIDSVPSSSQPPPSTSLLTASHSALHYTPAVMDSVTSDKSSIMRSQSGPSNREPASRLSTTPSSTAAPITTKIRSLPSSTRFRILTPSSPEFTNVRKKSANLISYFSRQAVTKSTYRIVKEPVAIASSSRRISTPSITSYMNNLPLHPTHTSDSATQVPSTPFQETLPSVSKTGSTSLTQVETSMGTSNNVENVNTLSSSFTAQPHSQDSALAIFSSPCSNAQSALKTDTSVNQSVSTEPATPMFRLTLSNKPSRKSYISPGVLAAALSKAPSDRDRNNRYASTLLAKSNSPRPLGTSSKLSTNGYAPDAATSEIMQPTDLSVATDLLPSTPPSAQPSTCTPQIIGPDSPAGSMNCEDAIEDAIEALGSSPPSMKHNSITRTSCLSKKRKTSETVNGTPKRVRFASIADPTPIVVSRVKDLKDAIAQLKAAGHTSVSLDNIEVAEPPNSTSVTPFSIESAKSHSRRRRRRDKSRSKQSNKLF